MSGTRCEELDEQSNVDSPRHTVHQIVVHLHVTDNELRPMRHTGQLCLRQKIPDMPTERTLTPQRETDRYESRTSRSMFYSQPGEVSGVRSRLWLITMTMHVCSSGCN